MDITLRGIVIIVGNYGSGKTEVSIHLALHGNGAGLRTRIADLDLVNPYFRTREAGEILAREGIDLVLPPAKYLHADLPILDPKVAGMLRQPAELTILDVGGDDVGATVLASLKDHLSDTPAHVLQVVNPFRPFTDTLAGCAKIRKEIEGAARLRINGLIGNANMMEETRTADILEGHRFVEQLARESGLPLHFITAPRHLLSEVDRTRIGCPVLAIDRQLVPPWKRPAGLFARTSRDP